MSLDWREAKEAQKQREEEHAAQYDTCYFCDHPCEYCVCSLLYPEILYGE